MASTLRIKKMDLDGVDSAYAVLDHQERNIGYVASSLTHKVDGTKAKSSLSWGYALVTSEFKNGIPYNWPTLEAAITELAKLRSVKMDTTSIKIIKN
jgi:hypothetical protein